MQQIEKDDNLSLMIPKHLRDQALKVLEVAKKQEKRKLRNGYRWTKIAPNTMRLIKAEK